MKSLLFSRQAGILTCKRLSKIIYAGRCTHIDIVSRAKGKVREAIRILDAWMGGHLFRSSHGKKEDDAFII